MKYIRMIALLLALCIVFSAVGCGQKPAEEDLLSTTELTTEQDPAKIRYNDLRLPYVKADSLDPFEAKSTVNRQLVTLLYDSLFTVSDTFEAKPLLAKEYSTDGLAIAVSVNPDIRFNDGSYMSVSDILYSFELAKTSDGYKARLRNIESASATGDNALLFTLSSPDPYAAACLDFPIIKSGTSTADRKAAQKLAQERAEQSGGSEDTVKTTDKTIPVGGGRYMLQYEDNEPDPVLVAFNDRFKGFYPSATTIHLINVTDSTALFYSLEIGNISFAFDDLSDGKYTRVNASITEYPMNNFVFMGINQDNAALALPAVRRALALAVDREDILNVAFQGHATVTRSPFNPQCTVAAAYESERSQDTKTALEVLEEAGFDQVNSYGSRNNGRMSLRFTMLVAEGNDFKRMTAAQIVKKLKTLDIPVTVKTVPAEEFKDAVELGKFDLYIGEVNLSANMDLHCFFGKSGALAHGIWSEAAAQAYGSFCAGEINYHAFMEVFDQDTPFVPLVFRKGIVASVKELQGTNEARFGDLFEDIEDWHY